MFLSDENPTGHLASTQPKRPARQRWRNFRKWLRPGLGIKRWLLLLFLGITALSLGFAELIMIATRETGQDSLLYLVTLGFLPPLAKLLLASLIGVSALLVAVRQLNRSILAPFGYTGPLVDAMTTYTRRGRGLRLVALGGGSGLPSVLRSFKNSTSR